MAAYRRHTDDDFYEEPYDEELERRMRMQAQRDEELRRYQQRQNTRHRVRKPSQGTWYEQSGAQQRPAQSRRRPAQAPARDYDLRTRGRYDVSRPQAGQQLQRRDQRGTRPARDQRAASQQQRAHASRPAQNKQYHVPRNTPLQPVGSLGRGGQAGAGAGLSGRALLIAVAIVVVLAIVFAVRLTSFGGAAELAAANEKVAAQQAQLEQVQSSAANLQSQMSSMQATIDKYGELVKSQTS